MLSFLRKWYKIKNTTTPATIDAAMMNVFVKMHGKKLIALTFILAVVMNIAFSPINPNNDHYSRSWSLGYQVEYSINPESGYMHYISGDIGHSSVVLASNNLFSYVANDNNAYFAVNSTFNNDPLFPFNSTFYPQYILYSGSQGPLEFSIISNELNERHYGLVIEIIYSGYPGNIYLYKASYTGQNVTYTA